jgi:quinol monooxygenase YgiN
MIRTILTLNTEPDRVQPVLDLYRTEDILQESLDLTRAISTEIAVNTDGSGELVVTALWPDEAAYREWIDHPRRGRSAPALNALLHNSTVGVGKVFQVDELLVNERDSSL